MPLSDHVVRVAKGANLAYRQRRRSVLHHGRPEKPGSLASPNGSACYAVLADDYLRLGDADRDFTFH